MCGINGIINSSSDKDLNAIIHKMNDSIYHRGPDDEGIYISPNNKVGLGMRRLSIIDLVSGSQPMYSSDKKVSIVFNGEIYNYKQVKEILLEKGVKFYTESDTEVILRGYEYWGKSVLEHLNGMFAFAIHDQNNSKVLIARDRFGEKPIYYTHSGDYFCWGSELKSIKISLQTIDSPTKLSISKPALNLYFALTYIPAPYSIYENIYKLESGCLMEVDTESLELKKIRYWDSIDKADADTSFLTYDTAKGKVKELLYDSVEKRIIADVPVGVFLSGGVDSSIVTAIMANHLGGEKVKSFSIGYTSKGFDESVKAESVAKHLKTEHQTFIIDLSAASQDIDRVLLNYDEPFADSSAIPTFWVSKMARKYVKVALTGDGGDEVFGGYNKYLMNYYAGMYQNIVPSIFHEKITEVLNLLLKSKKTSRNSRKAKILKTLNAIGNNNFENMINIISLGFQQNLLRKVLKPTYYIEHFTKLYAQPIYDEASNLTLLKQFLYLDKNVSLDGDMLTKVDRASMFVSLECRAPFLDHRLIEFTNNLPDNYLIKGRNKKRILKDAFEDMLPSGLFRLPKKGFELPLGDWLKSTMRQKLIDFAQKDFLIAQNIFNYQEVNTLLNEHFSSINDHSSKLWTFYCFQLWYSQNVDVTITDDEE